METCMHHVRYIRPDTHNGNIINHFKSSFHILYLTEKAAAMILCGKHRSASEFQITR